MKFGKNSNQFGIFFQILEKYSKYVWNFFRMFGKLPDISGIFSGLGKHSM